MELKLKPVPKLLGETKKWAPECFVVSFKLETDDSLLESKAKSSLEKYKHNVVIANTLLTRKRIVHFYTKNETKEILLQPIEEKEGLVIEQKIVQEVIQMHSEWINLK